MGVRGLEPNHKRVLYRHNEYTCGTSIEGSHLSFLFSGHDVERWLLRTVAALAVSKNFSIDGAQLDDGLVSRLKLSWWEGASSSLPQETGIRRALSHGRSRRAHSSRRCQ
jgi:hypothetical protein